MWPVLEQRDDVLLIGGLILISTVLHNCHTRLQNSWKSSVVMFLFYMHIRLNVKWMLAEDFDVWADCNSFGGDERTTSQGGYRGATTLPLCGNQWPPPPVSRTCLHCMTSSHPWRGECFSSLRRPESGTQYHVSHYSTVWGWWRKWKWRSSFHCYAFVVLGSLVLCWTDVSCILMLFHPFAEHICIHVDNIWRLKKSVIQGWWGVFM